jgi:hypothetical protein
VLVDDGSPLGSHGSIGEDSRRHPDRSRLTAPTIGTDGELVAACAVMVTGWITELQAHQLREGIILPAFRQFRLGEAIAVAVGVFASAFTAT